MDGERCANVNYGHRKGEYREPPQNKQQAKSFRREDFIKTYQWQLAEFGEKSHKIITTMPLNEYYKLGICCIDNEISIAEFIRQAIRANIDNVSKIAKKINKNNINPNQGSLF